MSTLITLAIGIAIGEIGTVKVALKIKEYCLSLYNTVFPPKTVE